MCEPASEYKTALPRCGRAVLRYGRKAAGWIAQMLHICKSGRTESSAPTECRKTQMRAGRSIRPYKIFLYREGSQGAFALAYSQIQLMPPSRVIMLPVANGSSESAS